MRTWRVSGKMHSEHIGSLGTVDADVSVRERLAFGAKLPERLVRLGNRVGPEEHAKIYGALHVRIPMVTPEEQRGRSKRRTPRTTSGSGIRCRTSTLQASRAARRRSLRPRL
jgi:hypothetical protein